jgi:hypothetical protein
MHRARPSLRVLRSSGSGGVPESHVLVARTLWVTDEPDELECERKCARERWTEPIRGPQA